MLHDGVIYWLSHGQQASLSVTHVEALSRQEQQIRNLTGNYVLLAVCTFCVPDIFRKDEYLFLLTVFIPGCVAPEEQV